MLVFANLPHGHVMGMKASATGGGRDSAGEPGTHNLTAGRTVNSQVAEAAHFHASPAWTSRTMDLSEPVRFFDFFNQVEKERIATRPLAVNHVAMEAGRTCSQSGIPGI